jgi:NADPH-dependent 2,4-dienoyl-CoA reductase/sulfur reductase-like enzyme
MAGVSCVEQILKHSPRFEVTIFGDETHANYNRILLSSVLAGEKSSEEITLNRSSGTSATRSACGWECASPTSTRTHGR